MKKKNFLEERIQKQAKEYNDEVASKTMKYQKKFGFELNPTPGHSTWNVEADAFKHAFMGADLALSKGNAYSLVAGIYHENQTPNNPKGEWNMDSWNNAEGRKIAEEIKKEYGNKFNKLSNAEKDAAIASKIILKMRNGELITHPDDKRKFKGFFENLFYKSGKSTGQAAPIENTSQPFTREQIGAMAPDEFTKNEPQIMKQLQMGQIKSQAPDFSAVKNSGRIFTREDIGNMSTDEYKQNEPQIMQQLKSFGIPSSQELRNNSGVVYVKPYTRSDGTEVRGYYRAK